MPPVVADGSHSQLPFVLDLHYMQYLLLCFNNSCLKKNLQWQQNTDICIKEVVYNEDKLLKLQTGM